MISLEDPYSTVTCVLVREDLLSGDIVGRSSRGTVRKIGQLFSFIAAVLAAMGRNLLNCGSSAVAISYCCRPALQEFGVRGGEHSGGRHRVSVTLRRFEATAATLDITPTAVDLRVPTHTCWCHRMSSSDIRYNIAYPHKHGLIQASAVSALWT